jgi:uncharacterized damage-inducible protein DinB
VGKSQSNYLLIQSHLKKIENAKSYTLSILDKVNEEQLDFKPVKDEMSIRDQLIHIGENIYWLSSTYLKEEENPIKGNKRILNDMNKEQIISFLNGAFDYAIKVISELYEKKLDKEFKWSEGKLNKYQFLNLIQSHQTHHTGQLIVYLRLKGIEPPKYVGW